jgi:hypothetical protein
MNSWLEKKQEKRINELLNKPYNSLSIQEKLELAYGKYNKRQKISYEEYLLMLTETKDEVWFWYDNTEYQIDYGLSGITAMYITEYDGKQKKSERSENYSSIIELLDQFRINGKTIKDIWKDVEFELHE